jgi:uncharacterized membrane protein YfcA
MQMSYFMEIYLPIAEISINIFLMIILGFFVGLLSGLFGIGGGFLLTPLMILMNIPASIAVGTGASSVMASSFTAMLKNYKNSYFNIKLGIYIVLGGLIGTYWGSNLFSFLEKQGHLESYVKLSYMILLLLIGGLMSWEIIGSYRSIKKPRSRRKRIFSYYMKTLPFKIKIYDTSNTVDALKTETKQISLIPVVLLGIFIGGVSGFLGVGGGFITVPILIYIIGIPTTMAIATSQFQMVFISCVTVFIHAVYHNTIDIALGTIIIMGSVIGAQIGVRFSSSVRADLLRIFLALLILFMGLQMATQLLIQPNQLYTVSFG